jgi:hypothetical protein
MTLTPGKHTGDMAARMGTASILRRKRAGKEGKTEEAISEFGESE